jgi:hypothetical protein
LRDAAGPQFNGKFRAECLNVWVHEPRRCASKNARLGVETTSAQRAGSTVDGTVAASWAAILASTSATRGALHRAYQFASHQSVGRVGSVVLP